MGAVVSLHDVPAEVREQMTFHLAMTVDEVLAIALEPARTPAVDAAHDAPAS